MNDTILKPAHDVLLEMANDTCGDLKAVKEKMDSGKVTALNGSPFLDAMELQLILAQRTGLLVGLMDALEKMIIPEAALRSVIETLNKLDYVHAAIFVAARTLDKRRRQIAEGVNEQSSVIEVGTERSSPAFAASPPWDSSTCSPRQ